MILGQDQNKKAILHAVEQNLPVLLIGETGTGKTSLVYELGLDKKKNVSRINLNGQTSVDEFLGKWLLKDKQTYWQDGILTQAMKAGDWIIVDEINGALPEILFSLHSLLDDDRKIILAEKDGEIVKPHEEFRFFATMNPSEEYAGTKDLNKAFMSRFPVVTMFNYPTPEIEMNIIIQRTGIATSQAKFIVGVANVLRKLKGSDRIMYTCSTRDLINYASLLKDFGNDLAFEYSILNKAGSEKDIIAKELEQSEYGEVIRKFKEENVNSFDELFQKYDTKKRELESTISRNNDILARALKNNSEADKKLTESRRLEKDLIDREEMIKENAVADFVKKFMKDGKKPATKGGAE